MVIVQGFNPEVLFARPDSGFQLAISALDDPQFQGEGTLEDGSSAYYLTASGDGAEISWLVVYLVQMTGTVNLDIYLDRDSRLPTRFVATQLDTISEVQPEPTRWVIDLYDFGAPAELDDPEAVQPEDAQP